MTRLKEIKHWVNWLYLMWLQTLSVSQLTSFTSSIECMASDDELTSIYWKSHCEWRTCSKMFLAKANRTDSVAKWTHCLSNTLAKRGTPPDRTAFSLSAIAAVPFDLHQDFPGHGHHCTRCLEASHRKWSSKHPPHCVCPQLVHHQAPPRTQNLGARAELFEPSKLLHLGVASCYKQTAKLTSHPSAM